MPADPPPAPASAPIFDAIVLGAGAAGMFCAIEAARRGRATLLLDHARAPGEKIRISGGGRCNFTNLNAGPGNFLSQNPRFCVSALKRFSAADFLARVESHGIAWHEKARGQLFCDGSARQIVAMLTDELRDAGATLRLGVEIGEVTRDGDGFAVPTAAGTLRCRKLVVATGGKAIPKMGASGFGLDLARRFGLRLTETRPALVPLTFEPATLAALKPLAGVACDARIACGKTRFSDALLFTHRGLSGPAILQISSYWREGGEIAIDLAPGLELFEILRDARRRHGRQAARTALALHLPRRLAQHIAAAQGATANLADLSDKRLRALAGAVKDWRVTPAGSEGYRTAEVMLGGVDTGELNSKTMQATRVPGLHFIGEAVDVTGWLGGYNFQWAWSSGWAAGQAV